MLPGSIGRRDRWWPGGEGLAGSAAAANHDARDAEPGANHVLYLFDYSSSIYMTERTSTGASSSYQSLGSGALPYWIKLARSGNVFTMYSSADGMNWLPWGRARREHGAECVRGTGRKQPNHFLASYRDVRQRIGEFSGSASASDYRGLRRRRDRSAAR